MPEAQPAKIQNRNDWSRFIVEHTPGAVITTDAQGRITEFNPAAARLTGYRREEALGQPMDQVLNCQGAEAGSLLERVIHGTAEETEELVLQTGPAARCRSWSVPSPCGIAKQSC